MKVIKNQETVETMFDFFYDSQFRTSKKIIVTDQVYQEMKKIHKYLVSNHFYAFLIENGKAFLLVDRIGFILNANEYTIKE